MNKKIDINEDALTERMQKAKRKRIRRYIRRILVIILVFLVVMLKFVFGLAYYRGETLAPKIATNSCVLYLKLSKHYKNSDLIVFKDITENKVKIQNGEDYEKQKNSDATLKTKVLGKIIWNVRIGGD